MNKFNYKKYGEIYEKGLDWILDVISENATPEKFNDKMILEMYVNDYIKGHHPELNKEEQATIIDEIVKQYYIL